MKKLIPLLAVVVALVIVVVLVMTPPASATTRYIAQSAGIFSSGTACKGQTAITPDTFNGTRNVPGDVNYICGTITGGAGAQLLTPKGNGAEGHPVTIRFDTGAILQAPYFAPSPNGGCGGAICLYGRSYYTIDGQNTGTIQNTANGTDLAYHQKTEAIEGYNCNHCTVQNLTIANMYVHISPGDSSEEASAQRCISVSGSNWLIQHNVMHDAGWCLFNNFKNGDGDVVIAENTIYGMDHGWMLASQVAGGSSGPFTFRNNTVYGYANWDTTTDSYHHDGIHCFTSETNGSPAHITLLAIYNNVFKGPIGQNVTAHIFIEGGSGAGSTPCADSTSGIAIFNNVGAGDQADPDGLFGLFSGNYTRAHGGGVYNNTLISTAGTGVGVCFSANSDTSGMTFENNALSGCNQLIETHGIPFMPDYNQYANGGGNAFVCRGNFYSPSQFSSWKTCVGGDSHSAYHGSLNLDSSDQPQARSPLIGKGASLTSLCSGDLASLCSGAAGNPRPSTGAWTVGARSTAGRPPA
ncbi:MAG TPA: hypothetical protein VHU89_05385 [Acidobacteriaceae bacterium]|jgi:hypothetical protein|nr:hypothetical protein [Acidobacteriaceae bacterium]